MLNLDGYNKYENLGENQKFAKMLARASILMLADMLSLLKHFLYWP